MNSKWIQCTVALALIGLGGCASMSADECLATDWTAIGYEDGVRGYSTERFGSHRKACAKHGVTASLADYRDGHAQGVEVFCQPSRGFDYGASGGRYYGVCPALLEDAFLDGYHAGHKLYTLRANVNAANSRIYAREAELAQTNNRIAEATALLISSETTTEERVLLLAELKELSERTGQLEAEIREAVEDRARHEQELEYYEQTVASYGY